MACLNIYNFVPITRIVKINYHSSLLNWQFFVFPMMMDDERIACLLHYFYSVVKQEGMEWHNPVILDWDYLNQVTFYCHIAIWQEWL